MALVTANDVAVISGSIVMPLVGVWSADLVLDQPDGTGFEAGKQVKIKADGGLEFVGVVVPDRTGDFLDSVHVRVIAGAGGMAKAATVKGYAQPGATIRDVLNSLAQDAGETLSSDIDSGLLTTNLTAWATLEGTVSAGLVALIDLITPTSNWRVRADGKLWVGDETWPTSSEAYDLLSADPSDRSSDLAVDTFTLEPGVNLDGIGKINRLEHKVERAAIRTHVWVELEGEERGAAGAIQALARQVVAKLDYFAFYDAELVKQSSDGLTVDVKPGDPRIPKLSNVPLRNGIAATTCKVSPGTTVRLGWDRGNPQKPFACLWQGGETVSRISIAGDIDAARKGDHADAGILNIILTGTTALSGTYTDPDGVVTMLASGNAVQLTAKIKEGSSKIGLG